MKTLRNEKGIALVMVLILSLIGLAMVATLMFMLTQGTRVSGVHRIFRTADEAGLGGANLTAEFIDQNVYRAIQSQSIFMPDLVQRDGTTTTAGCLVAKLTLANTGTNWTGACSGDEMSYDITTSPDLFVSLPGSSGQNFTVNAKIVDTVPGSTDTTGLVRASTRRLRGVIDQSANYEYHPPSNPYLYRIEVQTQDSSNRGVSRYSILYAY